jgi:hypothetical protein
VRRAEQPGPTDEEAAAAVVAIMAVWPRHTAPAARHSEPERWRFSGRWWAKPIPSRRDRPGR